MGTTTGIMTHKNIGYEGQMIRVGDCNFMVPPYLGLDLSTGDSVTVEWSVDKDGVVIAGSVTNANRFCEHCHQEVPLKCADPSGNIDIGFCERAPKSLEAKDGD